MDVLRGKSCTVRSSDRGIRRMFSDVLMRILILCGHWTPQFSSLGLLVRPQIKDNTLGVVIGFVSNSKMLATGSFSDSTNAGGQHHFVRNVSLRCTETSLIGHQLQITFLRDPKLKMTKVELNVPSQYRLPLCTALFQLKDSSVQLSSWHDEALEQRRSRLRLVWI